MNFTVLGSVDVWELAASTRLRMHLFPAPEEGRRTLRLRVPKDEGFAISQEWKKWPELRNTIARIQRVIDATPLGPTALGAVSLELLEPNCELPWWREGDDYFARYARLHLPLRTNAAAMMFGGNETFSPAYGSLVQVNQSVRQSAANYGEHSRIHAVIDLTRKD